MKYAISKGVAIYWSCFKGIITCHSLFFPKTYIYMFLTNCFHADAPNQSTFFTSYILLAL